MTAYAMAADAAVNQPLGDAQQPRIQAWAVCTAPVAYLVHLVVGRKQSVSPRTWTLLLPIVMAAACFAWLSAVSREVPEPYLDEVFHIPQAQRYCQGRFREWDDKITTPPGLYLLSNLLLSFANLTGLNWAFACDASSLRAINTAGLFVLAYFFLLCRHQIEGLACGGLSSARKRPFSEYAFHSACNAALFPLLFFFSGLYYTDVISTAIVLVVFLNHLARVSCSRKSVKSDFFTVVWGIIALLMRQTNVFWIVVYMGGLEAVHAVKSLGPGKVNRPAMNTLQEQVKHFAWRYSAGDVHDPPLNRARPDDALFAGISLGVAVLSNPRRVLKYVWPYLTVLGASSGFVAWNGGVVLGDKSNHVATIHLAQMLYIWPFFAFFSLPLVLPYALGAVNAREWAAAASGEESRRERKLAYAATPRAGHPWAPIRTLFYFSVVAFSSLVVRYNTIVHPFTLADNRHYMFYVFRHTIRRASWIRYVLIVPYMMSAWIIICTSAGCNGELDNGQEGSEGESQSDTLKAEMARERRETQAPAECKGAGRTTTPPAESRADPLRTSLEPMPTSTGLIFLAATSLSLITAPLVEPRYFIIPWVMWRLQLPAWRPAARADDRSTIHRTAEYARRHDVRLVLETAWFLAVNLATCYVFLAKPYIWKAEDGSVLDNGRLQRFMW